MCGATDADHVAHVVVGGDERGRVTYAHIVDVVEASHVILERHVLLIRDRTLRLHLIVLLLLLLLVLMMVIMLKIISGATANAVVVVVVVEV